MTAIPRYRSHAGPVILSAGFRPFFLGSAVWAVIGVPLWLGAYMSGLVLPTGLAPAVWHGHEMIFGFASATVAGFLLTAIPNWTGRLPLQGGPLGALVLVWAIGRVAVLLSAVTGAPIAAIADLSFPAAFLAVVAREIVAGRNWRNLPVLGALSLLLIGNLLVHLEALGIADTAALGNRLGLVTLILLISLVGGRIIPSFTRNWLVKNRPAVPPPVSQGWFDVAALVITAIALLGWAIAPDDPATSGAVIIAGIAVALRLSRWRGSRTAAEPLLLILHIGYGWLALGLLLLGANGLADLLPATAALHALTVGAVGTMTLAVMTRATLGHTGRPLSAGPATKAIYGLVTIAAVLRILSPLAGAETAPVLWAAGASWSGAFGLFALFYGVALVRPRIVAAASRPI
ncbi:MAG TPA: NnrS family protein [Stellaceae bacterium]|nr:NnrS family protein [Stellaceae bacterium]